jgi:solute:Na+ symporter, SSS family
MTETFEVGALDIGILIGYLVLSRLIPLLLTRGEKDSSEYFLGGRNFVWPLIGFSLFATNMSGASFVGLAGAGYNSGISVYSYEWMAAVILVLFVFFILPFYLRSEVFTMPEFLERRYDRRSRTTFAGFLVFMSMFVDAAAALYAGGLVARTLFPGPPLWVHVAALALLAGVYTIFGGLGAVVISDSIQAVVLILGGALIFFLTWLEIPSWAEMEAAAPAGALNIIQPIDDPALPWPGLFTGVLIIGIYFWTTNQLIVQRTLGAKSLDHGRWGSLFAGLLKLSILWIMIFQGTMAIVLYPDLPNPDLVFPTLAFDLLPIGIRGLILAALVAAITSSVDSILNSSSTLVTMDFVREFRPQTSDAALVQIGRITTGAVMIVSVAWAPQIENFPSLWQYLQSVLSYTVPPVVAVFLVGIFWRRANGVAAFVTLLGGILIGVVFFILNEIQGVFDLQFLYASGISFALSLAVLVGVSLMTTAPDYERVDELVWTPRLWREETRDLEGTPWWQNYRLQSVGLLALTAVIVGWFW